MKKSNRKRFNASGRKNEQLYVEKLRNARKDIRMLNLAICNHCRQCCGGIKSEIGKCTVKKCALWKIIKKAP